MSIFIIRQYCECSLADAETVVFACGVINPECFTMTHAFWLIFKPSIDDLLHCKILHLTFLLLLISSLFYHTVPLISSCFIFETTDLESSERAKGNLSFSKYFLIQSNVFYPLIPQSPIPHLQRRDAEGQLRGQTLHLRHPQQNPRGAGLHLTHYRLLRHSRGSEPQRYYRERCSQTHSFGSFTCFYFTFFSALL